MRSIEPYQDFNLAMRKTEQDMMLRLLKMAHSQRGKLAEAMVSTGINNPQIGPAVAKIAGATARKASEEVAATLPKIDTQLHKMLDAALREDELAFIPDGPLADTDERKAMTLALAGAWGGIIAGKLLQVIYRLQSDGVKTSDAVSQVLGEEADVLGVADKVSPWTSVINEARLWVADSFWDNANGTVAEAYDLVAAGTKEPYRKQWVSAVDERSTQTCLELHGAIVPLDEPFTVTGTPRFADEVDGPPAHWNCRSALVLIREDEIGDELTQQMEATRELELERRKGLTSAARSRELKLAQSRGKARRSILAGVGGSAKGETVFYTKKIYRKPGSGVQQGGVTGVDLFETAHVVRKKDK